jgi:hypothetical protein
LRVEAWCDHYVSKEVLHFWVGFCSRDLGIINKLLSARWKDKTILDLEGKFPGDSDGYYAVIDQTTASHINHPIHEYYQSGYTYFGMYRDLRDLDVGRAVSFVEAVIGPAKAEGYVEGACDQVTRNQYERDPVARQRCLELYGYKCQICEIDFAAKYGDLGKDFIHVHHLNQLADFGKRLTNPEKDLLPVCPNCHAMLHRKKPPVEPEALWRNTGDAGIGA